MTNKVHSFIHKERCQKLTREYIFEPYNAGSFKEHFPLFLRNSRMLLLSDSARKITVFFLFVFFFPCYPVTCARSSYDRYISNRRARQRALGNNIIIDLARVKSEVLVNIYSLLNKIQNCVTPRGEGNENSQKNQ